MPIYRRNRNCPCARCRAHGLMGAGILVTLGILFLLDTTGFVHFYQTWPVLLLVIGAFIFLTHSASVENHIDPYAGRGVMSAPPPAWNNNPPPPPPAAPPEQNSQVKP
ncbi:MAG TPA: DUF5668 domain-containing protein [Candidatus Angelobacter sp.]|nr:DUF5668 domain-containing protein [Candidatus Angelobacter sp.]